MHGTQDGGRLRFQADWGGANLTRICGWLAACTYHRSADQRLSVIRTGRGMGDNLRALADDQADVAVITPAAFARLAHRGEGPFQDAPMPGLRAIARLPHRDAMVVAVRRDLPVAQLDDLATLDRPLRLTIGATDPDGFMGLGAHMVLETVGLDAATIRAHGGTVLERENPFLCMDDVREDRADVIIQEAIMTPGWNQLARDAGLRFLSLTSEQLDRVAASWGIGQHEIPAGHFVGQDTPIRAMDYSGFLVVATEALDDETARILAEAVIHDAPALERHYRHLPPERSPLTYPITIDEAVDVPIPLHEAAARVLAVTST